MDKIGIMGAMPEEVAFLLRAAKVAKEETVGMRTYVEAEIGRHRVVLVFSRWGKVAAATAATTLLQRHGVGRILFTGVAGGADPGVGIGDVVVGSRMVQHDMDASAVPGLKRFEIPLLNRAVFEADPALARAAAAAARRFVSEEYGRAVPEEERRTFGIAEPRVHDGLIGSGDRFIADRAELARLRAELEGLLCVEMEGAAVAQVCHEHGVPFALLRVVSDKADEGAPHDFARFVSKVAAPLTGGVVLSLLQDLDPQG